MEASAILQRYARDADAGAVLELHEPHAIDDRVGPAVRAELQLVAGAIERGDEHGRLAVDDAAARCTRYTAC